jgi:MoxR-like ATPase
MVSPTALPVAAKIRDLCATAKTVFIERDDAIDALGTCLCAGEHLLFLGKPGLAKSAIVHWLAAALNAQYFWIVLNADTMREDLVGPISLKALNEDRWDRKWAALALADIALVDEVGKASNQVVNMLLNALEERKFPTPDGDKKLPLHIVVGVSNETLDGDAAAMWDRFTVRTVVEPIQSLSNFRQMLASDVEAMPAHPVTRDELCALRLAANEMALHPAAAVLDTLTEMKSVYITKFDNYISDRRWRRILRVGAGHALLHGRSEIEVEDLIVAKWMLWENVDPQLEEIRAVESWVKEYAERGLTDLLGAEALIKELVQESQVVRDQAHAVDIIYKCRKLAAQIKKRPAGNQARWNSVRTLAKTVEETVMNHAVA